MIQLEEQNRISVASHIHSIKEDGKRKMEIIMMVIIIIRMWLNVRNGSYPSLRLDFAVFIPFSTILYYGVCKKSWEKTN